VRRRDDGHEDVSARRERLRRVRVSLSKKRKGRDATDAEPSGTVELSAPQPYVPPATPFTVPEEDVESYAVLTSDLESFADRRVEVLRKHSIADEDALARHQTIWEARMREDTRLRMHWEGLHRSFCSFIERERARGKKPCP
jgi:hypothetical protein